MKKKVYLAAPMFSQADQMFNSYLAGLIRNEFGDKIDLYVPQENKSINDKTKCATAEDICVGDFTNNLDKDDIMIALVDGNTAPGIGTVLEIGYFSRICKEELDRQGYTDKKIISLYTDCRECSKTVSPAKNKMLNEFSECQYAYLNLLLVGALKRYGTMCSTIDEVLAKLREVLA